MKALLRIPFQFVLYLIYRIRRAHYAKEITFKHGYLAAHYYRHHTAATFAEFRSKANG